MSVEERCAGGGLPREMRSIPEMSVFDREICAGLLLASATQVRRRLDPFSISVRVSFSPSATVYPGGRLSRVCCCLSEQISIALNWLMTSASVRRAIACSSALVHRPLCFQLHCRRRTAYRPSTSEQALHRPGDRREPCIGSPHSDPSSRCALHDPAHPVHPHSSRRRPLTLASPIAPPESCDHRKRSRSAHAHHLGGLCASTHPA